MNVKPKLGVEVNGEEVAVTCTDDEQLVSSRRGYVKGDRIELRVEVLPPFGSQGEVTFALPGAITRQRREWK